MLRSVLESILELAKKNLVVLLLTVYVIGSSIYYVVRRVQYRNVLKSAQERIIWQDTTIRSQGLTIKEMKNQALLNKYKKTDVAAVGKLSEIRKKNELLRKERERVVKESEIAKRKLKSMTLEQLNRLINGELQ